jgi:ribosome biogenesis GTPase
VSLHADERSAEGITRGVIVEGTGGVWKVHVGDGTIHEAALAGRLKQEDRGTPKLAVGDQVSIEPAEGSAWRIVAIEPRTSVLARREPGRKHGERVLAANVDQVLVTFAVANPEPHVRMIDRFLVICEGNGLHAHLVLNKVELVPDTAIERLARPYERAGYRIHRTSAKRGDGLEPLRDALAGRVTAFTGPSGVGKSSLLNALHPGLRLRTQEISASVNKGRHTTVGAKLIPLPSDGGYLVDTPGLREVGMWNLPSGSLDQCFPEFRPLIGSCRFQDCSHRTEPGCAIREAVSDGRVDAERHESYRKLVEELRLSENAW